VDECKPLITGSNSVNVFLGLGLPWVIASVYYESQGSCFKVRAGALGFSVIVFLIFSSVCLSTLLLRRLPGVAGAELGGPEFGKKLTVGRCRLSLSNPR
jgi:solute carrier family 8 (sodium/calcium exchanger)